MMKISPLLCALTLFSSFLSPCVAGEENLLAVPEGESLDMLWAPARNKEFSGHFSCESEDGSPFLKVTSEGTSDTQTHPYGEWRFKQELLLEEGVEYHFRVRAKGAVEAPEKAGAYVTIYGFDANETPRLIFIRQFDLSEAEYIEFEGNFRVPAGIQYARIGVGISNGTGWVNFKDLQLAPFNP